MIESYYWKLDLLEYAKRLKTDRTQHFSKKRLVNLEKDIILLFFMIRKLAEHNKFSSDALEYQITFYKNPCVTSVNNLNYISIENLYDFNTEKQIKETLKFVCNQIIHSNVMFAYREKTKSWGGIYFCSDFERDKFLYRLTLEEIIKILEITGNDYPNSIKFEFCHKKNDYTIKTK